jgi:hypothetical protein
MAPATEDGRDQSYGQVWPSFLPTKSSQPLLAVCSHRQVSSDSIPGRCCQYARIESPVSRLSESDVLDASSSVWPIHDDLIDLAHDDRDAGEDGDGTRILAEASGQYEGSGRLRARSATPVSKPAGFEIGGFQNRGREIGGGARVTPCHTSLAR